MSIIARASYTIEPDYQQSIKDIESEIVTNYRDLSTKIQETADGTVKTIQADFYTKAEMDQQTGSIRNEITETYNSWSTTIIAEVNDPSIEGSMAQKLEQVTSTLVHQTDGVWLMASGTESSNTALWLKNAMISFVINGDKENPPLILTPDAGEFERIIVRKQIQLGSKENPLLATVLSDGSIQIG